MLLDTIAGIKDVDIKGKRILVRTNYTVKRAQGEIHDTGAIVASIPTIEELFKRGAYSVVLASHWGFPQGITKPGYSLWPVACVLQELLDTRKVYFIDECCGPFVERTCSEVEEGSVVLLENLRFRLEEEGVDYVITKRVKLDDSVMNTFRSSLSRLGDIYVNDAFDLSVCEDSSIVGISLPVRVAGLQFEKEIRLLAQVLEPTKRPLLAILGGNYLKGMISLINNLLDKVDMMIIGGELAYTFLKVVHGVDIGYSKYDEESALLIPGIIEKAKRNNVQLMFPEDVVCVSLDSASKTIVSVVDGGAIPPGLVGVDIGPKSVERFATAIAQAKVIIWKGLPGFRSFPNYSEGTLEILQLIIEATKNGCTSILVGYGLGWLAKDQGATPLVSHVSTGGPSTLALLEGKQLPGVQALCLKTELKNNKDAMPKTVANTLRDASDTR